MQENLGLKFFHSNSNFHDDDEDSHFSRGHMPHPATPQLAWNAKLTPWKSWLPIISWQAL